MLSIFPDDRGTSPRSVAMAANGTERPSMTASNGSRPRKPARREKVAHIRFSDDEMQALEAAAEQAGLSVSAFVRSLSLEGAGIRPFMSRDDRAIIEMLVQDMRVVGRNINQLGRSLSARQSVPGSARPGPT